MEPDEAIKNLAKRKGVYPVWGTGHLMADLAEIVRNCGVHQLLTAARIAPEVFAVTDGLIRLSQAGGGAAAGGAEPAGSVFGRNLPGVLRLTVGGTTVITIRSNAVRCRLVTRNPTGRKARNRAQARKVGIPNTEFCRSIGNSQTEGAGRADGHRRRLIGTNGRLGLAEATAGPVCPIPIKQIKQTWRK